MQDITLKLKFLYLNLNKPYTLELLDQANIYVAFTPEPNQGYGSHSQER